MSMLGESPFSQNDTGGNRGLGIVEDVVRRAIQVLDGWVNARSLDMFERMLKEIADLPNFYREKFDTNASYYPKLLEIFEVENEITLVASDAGKSYKVEGCKDVFFTRKELDEIGNRYTHIKFPELS